MSNITKFIDNRIFFKSNYDKAIEHIIPKIYFEQEQAESLEDLDIIDKIINSNLRIISGFNSIINISNVRNSIYSSINTPAGIANFFIKQNNLTFITQRQFEDNILIPLGKSFRDFATSSEFSNYINTYLLHQIKLNNPSRQFVRTPGLVGSDLLNKNHEYLIEKLSWLYFLNTTGNSYSTSSYVHDLLVEKIYNNKTVTLNDGIKGLETYIWKNFSATLAWKNSEFIPKEFLQPVSSLEIDPYTSGTNQLEKLLTLVDVVYSPLFIDDSDTRVRDAIDNYLSISTLLTKKIRQGPFTKLIKAFSFAFADYSNQVDLLEVNYDLDECPDSFLPHIAELLGWKLFGSNPRTWRLQLLNSLHIYRSTGTKKAIQFAINSSISRDNFDVSSSIKELWESYVPNLIYYALATDSVILKSFNTWTRETANDLNITTYSISSMDDNIKLCTDKILLDLVTEYPNQFLINNKPFQVSSDSFSFNYRNRVYPIPPFEEIPYYENVIVTKDLIDYIINRLIYFGVTSDIAFKVGEYIHKLLEISESSLNFNHGFLFFTNNSEYPPNWDSLINDATNSRLSYLSLWSGKSSHFSVVFDTSSFDFSKNSIDVDSKEILSIASQTINEFSPAHSIPEIVAVASESDSNTVSSNNENYLLFENTDFSKVTYDELTEREFGRTPKQLSRFWGYNLSSLSFNPSNRYQYDSLSDELLSNSTVVLAERNTHRRRNFKFILPTDGFFSRDGTIPRNSNSVFLSSITNVSSVLNFNAMDRGQLHPIISTMHSLQEKYKVAEAEAYYFTNPNSSSSVNMNVFNLYQSQANYNTEYNKAFPDVFEDYINFKFGKELFKLYDIYINLFKQHKITKGHLNFNGPTIFAHIFGSIIKNSDLSENGFLSISNPSLISTRVDNITVLDIPSLVFNNLGLSGSYVANTDKNVYVETQELRNSGILQHVELCHSRYSNIQNSFEILRISYSDDFQQLKYNNFWLKNTVIKQKSFDGFSRIIFDIGKYPISDTVNFNQNKNFLMPDHKYKLNIKSLVSSKFANLSITGNIGIWIHTKESNGFIWSFSKDNKWVRHSVTELTRDNVLNNYSHISIIKSRNELRLLKRAPNINLKDPKRINDFILSIGENEFTNIELNFNTHNSVIDPVFGQVHNINQDYTIEVFKVPSEDDSFALFYGLNLIDLSLVDLTKMVVDSKDLNSLREFKINVSKNELYTIIKYFNELGGSYSKFSYASRNYGNLSEIYGDNGGSRANYMVDPRWSNHTILNAGNMIGNLTITN